MCIRKRRHGVVGPERPPVVEDRILAQPEDPDPRIRARLPAGGKLAPDRAVRADLRQAVEHGPVAHHPHDRIEGPPPVERAHPTPREAQPQRPAALRQRMCGRARHGDHTGRRAQAQ
jgi:hypothetical protein